LLPRYLSPPHIESARGSLPFRAAGVVSPQTTERSRTMTGVIFLLAVSALLGGSLVLSRDA
jgi:hypothetical protein